MPQPFNNTTITEDGIKLLNKAQAGEAAVEFTRIAVGDGQYQMDDGSITQLWKLKGLKSERNTYSLSSVSVHSEGSVRITALITNCDPITGEVLVTEGYHINEMGLYAKEKGKEGSEVLYSVSVASGGKGDFMPPYNIRQKSHKNSMWLSAMRRKPPYNATGRHQHWRLTCRSIWGIWGCISRQKRRLPGMPSRKQ